MNKLLQKENILYDSVIKSETDKGTLSAFHDYATFLSDEGMTLLLQISSEIKELKKEKKEYEELFEEIISTIKKDTLELEDIVKNLGLENSEMLSERFMKLHNFLDGNYSTTGTDYFSNARLDFIDILRALHKNQYDKEVSKYIIFSAGDTPFINDATAFKDIHTYYSLKRGYDQKRSRTVVGSFIRVLGMLSDMNDIESTTPYTRNFYIDDVKKVHKSIILNNLNSTSKELNSKHTQIFSMKGEEIYHYEIGLLTYDLVSTQEPKYITMFKDIIRYMPQGKNRIRVSEFERLMSKSKNVGIGEIYKNNLGNSGTSFHDFLKRNGVHNVHPKSKKPIIKVTRDYIDFNNILFEE